MSSCASRAWRRRRGALALRGGAPEPGRASCGGALRPGCAGHADGGRGEAPTERREAVLDAPTVPREASLSASPGTRPPPPPPPWRPNIPRKLGPYRLVEEIGHGGMGIVYRARHERLETPCAVKVLIAGEMASPEAIARFQREAAAVAKMGKHPHIVTVHDLGQEGAIFYYAMDLVEGRPLSSVMSERTFSVEEVAGLVEKVARALHYAHEHGVIHRDVKPSNIVVRTESPSSEPGPDRGASRWEPQVLDFGLARDVGASDRLSATGDIMGTPAYMAPEQARGDVGATDARTDVYALGAVMYEMLTRVPPHPGTTIPVILEHVLNGEILPARRLRPELPRDLETVCLHSLDREPGKRYATAAALADDLARFLRSEPVHARPVGFLGRSVRRVKRHPRVSGLLAGVAVLLLVLGWNLGLLAPAYITVVTDPPDAKREAIGTRSGAAAGSGPRGRSSSSSAPPARTP